MKFLLAALLSFSALAGTINIMSYNVENLFDAQKDEGKNDWTFLPNSTKGKKEACSKVKSKYRREECYQTDWTQKKVDMKLSQIKDVVLKEGHKLPDLMALSEIENANVVGQLAKVLGYKHYYTSNSPDKRGIDLAVMFNETKDFKFVSKTEHVVSGEYFKKRPTRNIFEVKFKLGGKDLFFFVNHWPSLGNPDHARVAAAKILKDRFDAISKKDKSAAIMAVGDFNTIPKLKKEGNTHPLRDVLLKDGTVLDLEKTYRGSSKISKSKKDALPPGTYYYNRGAQWNHLDRIFISKSMLNGKVLDVDLNSFEIYAPDFIRKQSYSFEDEDENPRKRKYESKKPATPLRYDHKAREKSKAGYSDHLPIKLKIKY